jgi:transposase
MAAITKMPVDIPDDKGVHVKRAGAKGEKYVYKYVSHFRNADGEPRSKAVSIGKYDPVTGKMRPNNNYFDLYNTDPDLPDISVWDYGYPYVVLKVCRDTGLLDCLADAFGETAPDVVAMSAYIIREGNAMDGIDDWLLRNRPPGYSRRLASQSVSKVFASLSPDIRERFFRRWISATSRGGTVCYDVTSVSSYAKGMPSVERGYNRDHDDLPQYNIGMFCDEATKTPLYYNRYNGSLTDKTNLSYALDNAKAVGIKRVKMILDGGFWSEECIVALNALCEAFTVGMPMSLDAASAVFEDNCAGVEKYCNKLDGDNVYCVSAAMDVSGVSGRALLFYDPLGHAEQSAGLSEKIDRLKAELSCLKRFPKGKLSRYSPYFVLTKHSEDGGFDYAVDDAKADALRRTKGFFMLFSTDMESSPSDILYYYRAKDADEKIFSQIKADMDGGRIRTHNEQTTDGKTFVTFVACVIRSYMLRRLEGYLSANSTSMKKTLSQLSDISLVSGANGYRFAKALTKKQKQILSAFDAVEDLVASVKKLSTLNPSGI